MLCPFHDRKWAGSGAWLCVLDDECANDADSESEDEDGNTWRAALVKDAFVMARCGFNDKGVPLWYKAQVVSAERIEPDVAETIDGLERVMAGSEGLLAMTKQAPAPGDRKRKEGPAAAAGASRHASKRR